MTKNILEELELAPGPGSWQSQEELLEPDAHEKSLNIDARPGPLKAIAFISESPEREFELKAWAMQTKDCGMEEWRHIATVEKIQNMWQQYHLLMFIDEYNILRNAVTDRINDDRERIYRLEIENKRLRKQLRTLTK